jgi:TonB family protein
LWNCGPATSKTLFHPGVAEITIPEMPFSQFFKKKRRTPAKAQTQGRDEPTRRRGPRYRVQAPLDVTVLRSGIPDTLPGRSVNLGERGVSAVLAGELRPGEAVGVEIRLPLMANPLRVRAVVRNHNKLRLGLEFVGLSAEQHAAIRNWASEAKAEVEPGVRGKVPIEAAKDSASGRSGGTQPIRKRLGRGSIFLLASVAILLVVFWWRWNRGWEDLEPSRQKSGKRIEQSQIQARVPEDVMLKLLTHSVRPDYPEAARPANLQGVIVLDVVVGRDGSVVDVRAQNGPEVLAQAATDALRWWRFEPYRVDGKAVVVETTVAVEFKP